MYAIRKDKKWEFYDNKNELLFPQNENIGPMMVHTYYHGWCKVQQLRKDKDDIFFQDGVIDEKGAFKKLPIFTEGYMIAGVEQIEGRGILFWSNWNQRFFMSPKGKKVPKVPSEMATYLGERFLADKTASNQYEIWDILEAKVLFKIEADALGFFGNGHLTVKKGGLWGVVNQKGEWELKPHFKEVGAFNFEGVYAVEPERSFQNGLLVVSEDSVTWGGISAKGKWKLKPQYSELLYLGQNHWVGKTENGWQLINAKGKIVKKLLLEDSPDCALIDNYIIGADAIYNLKGKVIHQGAEAYQILGDGFFVARIEGQLHLYNAKKLIKKLPPDIKLLKLAPFSNGLSTVKVFKEGGIGYLGFLNQT